MGLLNQIFGSNKDIVNELKLDFDKRLKLWEEHLANFPQREKLVKFFSSGNIDKALADDTGLENILSQLESLLSPELISIGEEEKIDKEILSDLQKLKETGHIEYLNSDFLREKQKQQFLIQIFKEIHDVLIVELHLINLIRRKPENIKEILNKLFRLVFFNESHLYNLFRGQFTSKDKANLTESINKISRAVLLQEDFKEEIETDKDKFVKDLVERMGDDESKHSYRVLGEDIYSDLVEMAGGPLSKGEDITEGIKRLEKLMEDDKVLIGIIKKNKPSYNKDKIDSVMKAFRESYDLGHFMELENLFAT